MADGVWEGVYLQVIGDSKQLLLISKFFDSNSLSKRKVDNGEKKTGKKDNDIVYGGKIMIQTSPANGNL